MPNISEHNLTVSAPPHQSPRDNAIDQLKDFDRRFNDGNCSADDVIDDFVRNFDSTELLDPVICGLSEEKKDEVSRAVARCHVASFDRGYEFLAKRNQLHLLDQDSATLIGALSAEFRAAIFARAYTDDRGQIVVRFPNMGLRIPLGRTSLGTGEGALTTHEIQKLLSDPEERGHSLLEIVSAKLVHFDAQTPDTETCHVWSDLIDRCIDRKPIAEFSAEKVVLEALAFTLMTVTDRIFAWRCDEEFPMVRMLTNSAEAYFLAGDHKSCGTALLKLAAYHTRKLERDAAVEVTALAASVLARSALKCWENDQHAAAGTSRAMALRAYERVPELLGLRGGPPAPISGVVDEIVPLPKLVEHICKSDFEVAWADRWAKSEEVPSNIESNLRAQGIIGRLAKSGA
ncbi:hypothetical protein [Pandoraea commovens]|uniref:Uncharacterized protein n=1 Tax=Pandoraea commovens TaxID=2508289 RepID=A0A5E4X5F1_9BURK|nr:hypothetical protein [Pandoraea commovens]VVE31564.1 hypothetical protein PCO31010_03703 [Pandoraea commovens]